MAPVPDVAVFTVRFPTSFTDSKSVKLVAEKPDQDLLTLVIQYVHEVHTR
jgi:hypothetical protein